MSTWNHRFIAVRDHFLDEDEELIQLVEVYYDSTGKPSSYSRPHLTFDDMEGVNNFVLRIMKAAQQPLLHEDDFPQSNNPSSLDSEQWPLESDE